jgi:hypothetical protein
MFSKNSLRTAATASILFVCAGIAAAQSPSIGSSATSELAISATVQNTVQLNISTGSGGAAVSGSDGSFSVNLGNINSLGLGIPANGVTKTTDASGALYTTPINLTPVYTGFTTETATISVDQDGASDDAAMVREGSSVMSVAPVGVGIPNFVAGGAQSGVAIERTVGMYAAHNTPAGAKLATLIYTVTVENN